ncbi:MAG: hypothetical protein WED33_05525, partial [Bacteroidia bacterium]
SNMKKPFKSEVVLFSVPFKLTEANAKGPASSATVPLTMLCELAVKLEKKRITSKYLTISKINFRQI